MILREEELLSKYSEELQSDPEFKDKVLIRMRFIGTKEIFRFGNINIDIEKNKYGIGKSVIERELKFKEGDVYDKSKMLESERNFTKLAIIQMGRVVIDSVDMETRVVYPDVVISLNNKYELTPSISTNYQSNRLYLVAGLEYKDKDFFGGGRVFSTLLKGFITPVTLMAECFLYPYSSHFYSITILLQHSRRSLHISTCRKK